MSDIKLEDLLKEKKRTGEGWVSFEAPYETWEWSMEFPWPKDMFKQAWNVIPIALTVKGKETVETDSKSYTASKPWRLKCGVDITGGTATTQTKRWGTFKFRVDSEVELAEALREIAKETGHVELEVQKLVILNPVSQILHYQIHNPDKTGSSLYFHHRLDEHGKTYYPLINQFEQAKLVGKFRSDRFAACHWTNEPLIECSIKHKTKAKNIRTRKKQ